MYSLAIFRCKHTAQLLALHFLYLMADVILENITNGANDGRWLILVWWFGRIALVHGEMLLVEVQGPWATITLDG